MLEFFFFLTLVNEVLHVGCQLSYGRNEFSISVIGNEYSPPKSCSKFANDLELFYDTTRKESC